MGLGARDRWSVLVALEILPDRTRILVALLRLGGVVTVMAFAAMLMPFEWMVSTHRALGLGEFPRTPVVEYLARSIAALYGFHGVLLLLVSDDPAKYRKIVWFIAFMNIAFGSFLVAIDVDAGMPMWWTLGEGPPIIAFGIVIAVLNRSQDGATGPLYSSYSSEP